jgi:hypothetical protein
MFVNINYKREMDFNQFIINDKVINLNSLYNLINIRKET